MGTLYYLAREGGSELFELGKVSRDVRYPAIRWMKKTRPLPSDPERVLRWFQTSEVELEWARRRLARLYAWAGRGRVRVLSEYEVDAEDFDWPRCVSGSFYDEDYDEAGNYIGDPED